MRERHCALMPGTCGTWRSNSSATVSGASAAPRDGARRVPRRGKSSLPRRGKSSSGYAVGRHRCSSRRCATSTGPPKRASRATLKPTWRKRGQSEGFCVRDTKVVVHSRRWAQVAVPKLGWVKFKLSRAFPHGKLGMARITRSCTGRWHVSFPAPQPAVSDAGRTGRSIGIDRGVATTVATSDGQMFRAPRMTRESAPPQRRQPAQGDSQADSDAARASSATPQRLGREDHHAPCGKLRLRRG